MLAQIKQLIELFAPRCPDRNTLDELYRMVGDKRSWHKAHDLFDRIRQKTLAAESRKDALADYRFGEGKFCRAAPLVSDGRKSWRLKLTHFLVEVDSAALAHTKF